MHKVSQFNIFPFEDQAYLHETKGVPADCRHVYGAPLEWTSLDGNKRWGHHCNKCPKWLCFSEAELYPKFKYQIKVLEHGLLLTLTYIVTGETRDFYMAGLKKPCPIEMHMRNMTDDLMLAWFVKFKREKKPKSKDETKAVPKAGRQSKSPANLLKLQSRSVSPPPQNKAEAT